MVADFAPRWESTNIESVLAIWPRTLPQGCNRIEQGKLLGGAVWQHLGGRGRLQPSVNAYVQLSSMNMS